MILVEQRAEHDETNRRRNPMASEQPARRCQESARRQASKRGILRQVRRLADEKMRVEQPRFRDVWK